MAVGLRPCSGAILLLVFALAQGLFWAGVAGTFVMAVGTAITVAAIATIAVAAKSIATRYANTQAGWGTVVLRGVGADPGVRRVAAVRLSGERADADRVIRAHVRGRRRCAALALLEILLPQPDWPPRAGCDRRPGPRPRGRYTARMGAIAAIVPATAAATVAAPRSACPRRRGWRRAAGRPHRRGSPR